LIGTAECDAGDPPAGQPADAANTYEFRTGVPSALNACARREPFD
jgi:hypothetical protein